MEDLKKENEDKAKQLEKNKKELEELNTKIATSDKDVDSMKAKKQSIK